MKQRASMVYPDHDAGGFAAIDAVLSHRHQLVFVDSSANAFRPRPRARERFDSQLIG
jgi:hypothetical protein